MTPVNALNNPEKVIFVNTGKTTPKLEFGDYVRNADSISLQFLYKGIYI